MPRKIKKKKVVEKVDEVAPEDPLKDLTDEELKNYEEQFKIFFDGDNKGEISADRIEEIMIDISDERVNREAIHDLVEEYAIKKQKP